MLKTNIKTPPAALQQDASSRSRDAHANQKPGVKLVYSTKEAATLLSVSRKTLYRLRDRGLLRPLAATRHLLWPHSELIRFIETTSI